MTPKEKLSQMLKVYSELEDKMVELALEHNLDLCLGEDRQGQRWLILEDESDGWRDLKRGDWMTSTMSCS